MQAKILNGTMDKAIFEAAEISEQDGESELVIHFKDLPICFAVEADKLYESYVM
ncbi:MAG: DUF2188 domain-containing protein [Lachnospiraceae bacterium]|nr:DUF2188 domain-containing protein [Lachnospiraceae bacterium]